MALTHSSTKKMEKLLKQIKKKGMQLYTEIHNQQQEIINNPLIGKNLKGDLKDFKSHDFKFKAVDIRICYAYHEEDEHVTFVFFGTRENFYDEVKRYLK